MRIAVASHDFSTVAGHVGRNRRFLVFEAEPGGLLREVERLDLRREQTIREFVGAGPHPLDNVDVIIAASAGDGFVGRMAARGVKTVQTAETDAVAAVKAFIGSCPDAPSPDPAQRTRLQVDDAVNIFKALANETRLTILLALVGDEKCVSDLEESLAISQPRASQELSHLRRAGLLDCRRLGTTTYYRLRSPHVLFVVEAAFQVLCEKKQKSEQDWDVESE